MLIVSCQLSPLQGAPGSVLLSGQLQLPLVLKGQEGTAGVFWFFLDWPSCFTLHSQYAHFTVRLHPLCLYIIQYYSTQSSKRHR